MDHKFRLVVDQNFDLFLVSIFGRFGVPKRAAKSFQNRSFFGVLFGTLFWRINESIFDRFGGRFWT